MATQTRFDLNAAVENWRNKLVAQLELSPDDRRELEKHLTDSIAELRERGLSEDESFWLAQRRIGQPQQLAEEFLKTNPGEVWRGRIFWMLFGSFMVLVWGALTNAFAIKLYSGKADTGWVDDLIGLVSAILPLIIGVLLVKGKLLRSASTIGWFLSSRKRFAITAIALSGVSSAVMALSIATMAENIHVDSVQLFPFAAAWLPSWFLDTISVFVIMYFMPKQERNVSKSA